MTLLSVQAHVRDFFISRETTLLKNYPGLKVDRILRELETLAPKLGMSRNDLLEMPYNIGKNSFLKSFFDKLEEGVPLEYILGLSFFYESEFVVSPAVLIPRSETELLVEMACQEIKAWLRKNAGPMRIVEVGTGSGAIALSILREIQEPLEIMASDISKDALEIAGINHYRLSHSFNPQSQMSFVKADRLEGIEGLRHLIISNPPYIKDSDANNKVHSQVDSHEPHLALYLRDDEYYQWFKDFFGQTQKLLHPGGLFLMEGHEDYLVELKEIAKEVGFDHISIAQDYTKRDRYLIARK